MWHETLRHTSKTIRYTIVAKIDTLLIDTAEAILIASFMKKEKKLPYLERAIAKLDLAKFFLQLAWEINGLEGKHYIRLSEPLNEVGKMLGGWFRQLAPKETPPK